MVELPDDVLNYIFLFQSEWRLIKNEGNNHLTLFRVPLFKASFILFTRLREEILFDFPEMRAAIMNR
jgi:hypothetical protein